MKKKIQVFLFIIAIVSSTLSFTPKANAYLGILDISSDPVATAGIWAQMGQALKDYGEKIAEKIADNGAKITITASKMAALLAVQKITQEIIGKGEGGVILDHKSYFFTIPQQVATRQMNSFFDTVSRGRLSSLNYEGVGPNHDAYLVAQARQAIMGRPLTTNLQDYATNPNQMFEGGNMKALTVYMECGNNPACYSLMAQSQYEKELGMAKKIAEMEQTNGFLPVKKNGKIIQPSAIVANALTQVDQLGTQVIMNAEAEKAEELAGAEMQIVAGAGINIAARTFNYALADEEGRAAIRNKNDEFPFSASYSGNTGFGFSAGGVTVKTGVGSWTGFQQIGNTCAAGGFEVDASGAAVLVNGQKRQCPQSANEENSVSQAGNRR